MKKVYLIRKYIKATSVRDALKKDTKADVDDIMLYSVDDEEITKEEVKGFTDNAESK